MIREISQAHPEVVAKPLPILNGGTGEKTSSAALAALNGIALSSIGTANNPIPLDGNVKIPSQYIPEIEAPSISLIGPTVTYIGKTTTYWISDFDYEQPYTLSALHGDVVQDRDTILYSMPYSYNAEHNITNDIITINGRAFQIGLVAPLVEAPSLLTPTFGATITSANLSVAVQGLDNIGYGIPTRYILDIAENNSFTLNNNSHIVTGGVPTLQPVFDILGLATNKTYYLRVQAEYTDEQNGLHMSGWSNVRSFTTANTFILGDFVETQLVTAQDGVGSDRFGIPVVLSNDGNLLVSGTGTASPGKVYIYDKQPDNTFLLNGEIISPSTYLYSRFGGDVALSGDKQILFIAAPDDKTNDPYVNGSIYVYRCLIPGDWTTAYLCDTLNKTLSSAGGYFAQSCCCAANANILVANDNEENLSIYTFNSNGICTLQGTIDTSIASLSPIDAWISFGFNYNHTRGFDISANGQRIIVGAPDAPSSYSANHELIFGGQAYIFDFNGTSWVPVKTFNPPITDIDWIFFGYFVAISPDGNEVFIADSYYNPEPSTYVYQLKNGTWTQTQKISIATPIANYYGAAAFIKFSGDGLTVVIGQENSVCVIYEKIDNIWLEKQVLSDPTYYDFGVYLAINNSGDLLAVGDDGVDLGNGYNQGGVYIFKR